MKRYAPAQRRGERVLDTCSAEICVRAYKYALRSSSNRSSCSNLYFGSSHSQAPGTSIAPRNETSLNCQYDCYGSSRGTCMTNLDGRPTCAINLLGCSAYAMFPAACEPAQRPLRPLSPEWCWPFEISHRNWPYLRLRLIGISLNKIRNTTVLLNVADSFYDTSTFEYWIPYCCLTHVHKCQHYSLQCSHRKQLKGL